MDHVRFLRLDQTIDAVQRNATVVANNTATAIGIRKSRDDVGLAGRTHLGRIGIEDALVVRLVILVEDLMKLRTRRIAVGRAGLLGHLDAAIGHEGTLEGLVRLKADDLLKILLKVTGLVRVNVADDVRIHVQDTTLRALFLLENLQLGPKLVRRIRRRRKERSITVVRSIVQTNELADIDFLLPMSPNKAFPFCKPHIFSPLLEKRILALIC